MVRLSGMEVEMSVGFLGSEAGSVHTHWHQQSLCAFLAAAFV